MNVFSLKNMGGGRGGGKKEKGRKGSRNVRSRKQIYLGFFLSSVEVQTNQPTNQPPPFVRITYLQMNTLLAETLLGVRIDKHLQSVGQEAAGRNDVLCWSAPMASLTLTLWMSRRGKEHVRKRLRRRETRKMSFLEAKKRFARRWLCAW